MADEIRCPHCGGLMVIKQVTLDKVAVVSPGEKLEKGIMGAVAKAVEKKVQQPPDPAFSTLEKIRALATGTKFGTKSDGLAAGWGNSVRGNLAAREEAGRQEIEKAEAMDPEMAEKLKIAARMKKMFGQKG